MTPMSTARLFSHVLRWKKSLLLKNIVSACCSQIFWVWCTRRAYRPKQLPFSESRCLHALPGLLASSKRQWISLVVRTVKLNKDHACLKTMATQNDVTAGPTRRAWY